MVQVYYKLVNSRSKTLITTCNAESILHFMMRFSVQWPVSWLLTKTLDWVFCSQFRLVSYIELVYNQSTKCSWFYKHKSCVCPAGLLSFCNDKVRNFVSLDRQRKIMKLLLFVFALVLGLSPREEARQENWFKKLSCTIFMTQSW